MNLISALSNILILFVEIYSKIVLIYFKERSVNDNGRLLTTRFGKRNGPLLTTRFGKRGASNVESKMENQNWEDHQGIENGVENDPWKIKDRLPKLGRLSDDSRTPFQLWYDRRFSTYQDDYKMPFKHMRYQIKK